MNSKYYLFVIFVFLISVVLRISCAILVDWGGLDEPWGALGRPWGSLGVSWVPSWVSFLWYLG